jgi:hypothetical protein
MAITITTHKRQLLWALSATLALASSAAGAAPDCQDRQAGHNNLYWGDLHVHTAFSMDAYAFGNRRDPGDAFAYGRGESLLLDDGKTLSTIHRPLDFMAVTDHAETFDVMYLCTDPQFTDNTYCKDFRAGSNEANALDTFRKFLLPVIAAGAPVRPSLCEQNGVDCNAAALRQWRRSQEFANAANSPCEFTAFIGNEWSATPNDRHWHRNLIFSSAAVTREALDYTRYPDVRQLWNALESQCKPEAGCDVITIPHNTNMSESGNFAIETDSDTQRRQRVRYERLIEVHQSKGNSECLPEHWDESDSDCDFELLRPRSVESHLQAGSFTREAWRQLRSSYARHLLSRGLEAVQQNPAAENPLQLGFIGSTDGHAGTAGNTAENNWQGDVWAWGEDPERRFERLNYNPGGLVAVWAAQNTRADIFAALKNRQVYGTSGTRIGLRFLADRQLNPGVCRQPLPSEVEAEMGGTLDMKRSGRPNFLVQASMDGTPLTRVDIVQGRILDGQALEQVTTVFDDPSGSSDICVTWADEQYERQAPAYWYARVLEKPTPRWSRLGCRQLDVCEKYPGADQMIQERAWSSPIWNLP